MKVLLICGSLAVGKDGVGDYSRRLSGELMRQGYQTSIIALNDKHYTEMAESIQKDGEVEISVLRLGKSNSWNDKIDRANEFIIKQNPDWVSLQYVPYSFHDKGLPYLLPYLLKRLSGKRQWHIMFHETFVGINKESSFKFKIIGFLQRLVLKRLVKIITPTLIQTNSSVYEIILKKMNIPAVKLPLISNIRPISKDKKNYGSKLPISLNFIVFGGIAAKTPINEFCQDLYIFSQKIKVKATLHFAGRNGNGQSEWVKACEDNKLEYIILGELEEKTISQLLGNMDFGLSTTPYLLSDKSAVITSYLSHGLKTICISENWTINLRDSLEFVNVFNYKPNNLEPLLLKLQEEPFIVPNRNIVNDLEMALSDWKMGG